MAERFGPGPWQMRLVYLLLILVCLFLKMLPVSVSPTPIVESLPDVLDAVGDVAAALRQEAALQDVLAVEAPRFVGPDWIIVITCAWGMRRPSFVPMLLVAAVLLLADFLLLRPPGLWAAFSLVLIEWMKGQHRRFRGMAFATEWLTFAGALLAAMLAYRLVMSFLLLEPGDFLLSVVEYVTTVLIYPVVVGGSAVLFGVRRATLAELENKGRIA